MHGKPRRRAGPGEEMMTSLGHWAAGCGLAGALAILSALGAARAETPPGVLVVAQSIDDAVSFDPAEGFELTTVQSFNNLYQRLVQTDRADATRIDPALATG